MMCNVRKTFYDDQYRQVPVSPSVISLHTLNDEEQPRGLLMIVLKYI